MRRFYVACCLYCLSTQLQASDAWHFSTRIAVTGEAVQGIFHHLEGAGRNHIAVTSDTIAVAWEDDSSGDPQVYAAFAGRADRKFSPVSQVSFGAEAYEPSITGLEGGRFVIAWEQDGFVFARSVANGKPGKAIQLSGHSSSHVSLVSRNGDIFCAWREQNERLWNLVVARLQLNGDGLSIVSKRQVEKQSMSTPLLYPSLGINQAGLNLAWEDRQAGHTRLKYSFSPDLGLSFSPAQYLNEFQSNRNQYDKGSGVTRVSLAAYGEDEVVAAWMDKRRGNAGYGIYSALGGEDGFGPNEKVHGMKGDLLPHYNPATAGNAAGDFAVAWDDYRQGNSDIWISSYDDSGEWSVDFAPPPASGAGEQSHPSIALDRQGNLHLLWIERIEVDGATRLWYSHGDRKQNSN